MQATIYGITRNETDYKKELVLKDCSYEYFKFTNGWTLAKNADSDNRILYTDSGRMMANYCWIELG